MPNGMTQAPIGDQGGGFNVVTNQKHDRISSVHKFPQEQFVHSLDDHASCLCGPQVAYQHAGDQVVPMVLHYALDVDYYWSDWGPDGPEPSLDSL